MVMTLVALDLWKLMTTTNRHRVMLESGSGFLAANYGIIVPDLSPIPLVLIDRLPASRSVLPNVVRGWAQRDGAYAHALPRVARRLWECGTLDYTFHSNHSLSYSFVMHQVDVGGRVHDAL
jgi:hypothetical protein